MGGAPLETLDSQGRSSPRARPWRAGLGKGARFKERLAEHPGRRCRRTPSPAADSVLGGQWGTGGVTQILWVSVGYRIPSQTVWH